MFWKDCIIVGDPTWCCAVGGSWEEHLVQLTTSYAVLAARRARRMAGSTSFGSFCIQFNAAYRLAMQSQVNAEDVTAAGLALSGELVVF